MRVSELANRYAKAVLQVTLDTGGQEKILAELRAFVALLSKDEQIRDFVRSPLIKSEDREAALAAALKGSEFSAETQSFLLLLANKDRLALLEEIVEAIKIQIDLAHGVTRGTVRSAAVLSPEERERIEDIVGRFTNKQVILSYREDPSVIGGLIAEVGSFTFDDTLTSHLRRLKDEISRRVQ